MYNCECTVMQTKFVVALIWNQSLKLGRFLIVFYVVNSYSGLK